MFKRTLAFALFLTTAANAADLVETPAFESTAADWSGLQLSVFGAATHTRNEAGIGEVAGVLIPLDASVGLFPQTIDDDHARLTAGIGVGYDHQFGSWVGGIAIDGSINPVDGTNRFSRIDPNPNFPFTGVTTNTSYRTDVDWLASAKLRLGYVISEDFMVYGTGGLAVGDVTNRLRLTIPDFPAVAGGPYTSPDWNSSGTETGFVVGVGVEKRLSSNLKLTFSLEYTDLSDVNVEGTDPASFPGEELNYIFDNAFTTAKVGLTFSF